MTKIDYVLLLRHIKEKISLKDFLEDEIGCDFSRMEMEDRGKCNCPFPDHNDQNASFFVRQMEDETWVYHCFGCGRSGTIIDFFIDYYEISFQEAIHKICKMFDIKNSNDIVVNEIVNSERKYDLIRKIDNLNIITSNQCRILLEKNFKKHIDWVKVAYTRLNKAIEDQDELEIENIGNQAFERMLEND